MSRNCIYFSVGGRRDRCAFEFVQGLLHAAQWKTKKVAGLHGFSIARDSVILIMNFLFSNDSIGSNDKHLVTMYASERMWLN